MPDDESQHQSVRAAKFKIERSDDEGVTLCVEAGKLRLRFFIDGQWSDLLQQVSAGEGELGQLVPFKMNPIPVSDLSSAQESQGETETLISISTIGAHPIPGLSAKDPAHKTPLWESAFPSLNAMEEASEETSRGETVDE